MHIDVKKLGRIAAAPATASPDGARARTHAPRAPAAAGAGWEFVHVCVDDATRLAYVEVLPDEKGHDRRRRSCAAPSRSTPPRHPVERVMTDNGVCYRSTIHAARLPALGIRHLRTRPYRPRTNGKAERFIRTLLGGWAYGAIYATSRERTAALDGWL